MELLHSLIDWLVHTIGTWGYLGIIILMSIESSFLPIPSEIIMIPAGYLVAKGQFNLWIVIALGTVGSLFGALINYYLAMYLGRPIFVRFGKYVGISEHHLEKVETFFHRHGEVSTFVGRLLPMVRHLISIPAGFAKMPLWKLNLFTLLGSLLWVSILVFIGVVAGQDASLQQMLLQETWFYMMIGIGIVVCAYIVYDQYSHPMEHHVSVSDMYSLIFSILSL